MTGRFPVRLGLIGDRIGRSKAPDLHRFLGEVTGRPTTYALHELSSGQADEVEPLLARLRGDGYAGVNVTFPFKEVAYGLVGADDLGGLGAVNTVVFGDGERAAGFNTDRSGFVEAFRRRFGWGAGVVAQLGAGGFGWASGFALAEIGATALRLYDPDQARAARLARAVSASTGLVVSLHASAEEAAQGADGVINASPVGMFHHPGCPIDPAALEGPRWVFDAVYAPLHTEFLNQAAAAGAERLFGSELFLWQGLHAYAHFHGEPLDEAAVAAATAYVQALFADAGRGG